MKKTSDEQLVKVPLSKLLKRFSHIDVIQDMEREYKTSTPKYISPKLIDDSSYLRKAKIDENVVAKDLISIKEKGIFSPLLIRRKKDHFEVVIGRKRLTAAKKLKLESVPCVLIDVKDEEALLMLAADIRDSNKKNMVELSLVCNKLAKDYKYTQANIASLMHISRSQVTNVMRLLNLPDNILNDISLGKLSFGHAKLLLVLPDDMIQELVLKIYEEHLSVRDVEKLIYEYTHDISYEEDEKIIAKKWGCKINIMRNRLVIDFLDHEDQTKLIEHLKK